MNLERMCGSDPYDRPGLRDCSGPTGTVEKDSFDFAQALIGSRQNVSPRRLTEPGPSAEQLHALLSLAAAAPDHGLLTPWRFIIVPAAQRHRLAEAFALALIDRDPGATLEQIESAREKAYRAPMLMVAVACLGKREPDTPVLERMVAMGAAIQNVLLGAHAMGYGAGLTSGQAMTSTRLRVLCRLSDGEVAVCCLNVGSVLKLKGSTRARPVPAVFTSELPGPLQVRAAHSQLAGSSGADDATVAFADHHGGGAGPGALHTARPR